MRFIKKKMKEMRLVSNYFESGAGLGYMWTKYVMHVHELYVALD